MEGREETVLIVDSYNLFIRNFIANPLMADGNHIGGIVGFLQSLGALMWRLRPTECVIVWEGGGSLRRRAIYPEYKSRRRPIKLNRFHDGDIPDTVENRNWQVKSLIACLKCLPIRQIYISDCEADDVIGYLAKYHYTDKRVKIVSSDHDYLQLIDDRVSVWSPTLKDDVDTEWVRSRYGVLPRNLCVARCFSGDSSDSLPGLKGLGFKTLLKRFPALAEDRDVSVEEIIENAKNHPARSKVKVIQEIVDHADVATRNWRLMHLDISNLSGSQIGKLQSSYEIELPHANKFALTRTLVKCGVKTFDIDRFYLQVTANIGKS